MSQADGELHNEPPGVYGGCTVVFPSEVKGHLDSKISYLGRYVVWKFRRRTQDCCCLRNSSLFWPFLPLLSTWDCQPLARMNERQTLDGP